MLFNKVLGENEKCVFLLTNRRHFLTNPIYKHRSFYIRSLSIHGFWYSRGILVPISHGYWENSDCNLETAGWKRCIGQGTWEGAQSFHALFGCTTSQHVDVFPTWKLLEPLSFWAFMEASLHRHNWLYHWPLVTELNLQPLFYPWWSGGWGQAESSNPLIAWIFLPWQLAPILRDFTKVIFINIKSGVVETDLSWIQKSQLENSLMAQGLGLRTFTAEGAGSIPGRGTNIPQAPHGGQKRTNKTTTTTNH